MKFPSNFLGQLTHVIVASQLNRSSCKLALRKMSTIPNEVIFQKISNKGVITLNRPKALNALSLNMVKLMYPQIKAWTSEVSCIIICTEDNKAFCAGGDVVAITDAGKKGDKTANGFFRNEYQLNHQIGSLTLPYVALINGITMGGGVGVSVHGKYRVATEKTVFAMPETAIGLFPDVGGSYFLSRMGNLGTFLALTGYRLKGLDVLKSGIATHYCDSSKVADLKNELINLSDVAKIPEILSDYTNRSLVGKPQEFSLAPHMDDLNKAFSCKTVEEIMTSLESCGSSFAKKQKDLLNRLSPSSLKVTLRLCQLGADLTFKECLKMEYRVIQSFMSHKDFYEGVRAVLIDKDNKPKWNPARLEDVTDALVDSYFTMLPPNEELHL